MGKILLENGTGMSGLGRMGAAQLIAFPAKLAVQGPRSPLGVGGGEDGLQTAGLDPAGRENLMANIREYHRNKGTTIILVSHSMEDVAKLADRIIVMHKGKIAGILSNAPKVTEQELGLYMLGLKKQEGLG